MAGMKNIDSHKLKTIGWSALIGLIVGLIVSCFRWLIEHALIGWKQLYHLAGSSWSWLLLVLVIFGIMTWLIGWIIGPEPHVKGSGIPEVELQLADELELKHPFSIIWRKFTAGVMAIGSGGLLGREGPSVQLGAAVGQSLAEKLKLDLPDWRMFVAAGAASGLSAAFSAPLAGTMFILEEVSHSFSPLLWLGSLSGALMADIVTERVFGLNPVLHITYTQSMPLKYYWILLFLGLILGLLGFLYQEATLKSGLLYIPFGKIPTKYHALVMFLCVLPFGIWFPEIIGGGNSLIILLTHVQWGVGMLLLVLIIRFVLSALSFGSGVPGGIFLPILTLGAVIGALYGMVLHVCGLLPLVYIPNLIIFAMAGYFAGISKAPFTAIILITEMVGSLSHLMPLAVVSLLAYLVIDLLGGAPIYESLAARIRLGQQLSNLTGHLDQFTFMVSPISDLTGKEVRAVNWPAEAILTRVTRDRRQTIAKGDFIIQPGDQLTILVDSCRMGEVKEFLLKQN
ncbi:ClC family H(+)/Cl(-) exchange transporter [Liquorilactobacillus nagelii]|jgi:H+/Cl- antiporter ClcA|uniref:ClC family H(+)/Cl(-) exchange transporter n=2 Tax=Liquorilactobacillus nagelii TaxID=82688 RepID=A0A3S6QX40_9LACO|nr:ClC family H(+)/Cl(-) exchange transporter [Liquorilactobacillus nagelii]